MTKTLKKLNKKLLKQAKQLKDQEKKIDCVQEVVYQLLGGLFNQRTQNNTLSMHINILEGNDNLYEKIKINEDIYPTTRQGDMLLCRVENIEARLQEIMASKGEAEADESESVEEEDESESVEEEGEAEYVEEEGEAESVEEDDDSGSDSDYEPSETDSDSETESETE